MAPTEMQTLILWALLAKPNGTSFQKDLIPEVKKPDREALVNAGLIMASKPDRRRWRLEITEKGWAWAGDHLSAELPKRSTAGSVILQAWLKQLQSFMKSHGLVLADIFGQRTLEPTVPLDYPAIREHIRKAYLDLTGGHLNTRVLLLDLREKLKGVGHSQLNEALKRMHLEEGTTLSGLNNPQEITKAISDAGLSFKGQPMYVLWITK